MASSSSSNHYRCVIIGGGIAAVSCAEMISMLGTDGTLLITASPLIKAVVNYRLISKVIEDFDVEERPVTYLENLCKHLTVLQGVVTKLDTDNQVALVENEGEYTYDTLCLCMGGVPKIFNRPSEFVLGIRDTETVQKFQKRLNKARRIVIVGNGGIATEMIYEIEGCDIVWAIKDDSIAQTFVDKGAAQFFLQRLQDPKGAGLGPVKRQKYTQDSIQGSKDTTDSQTGAIGNALGPDWATGLNLKGTTEKSHSIHVEYSVEVEQIITAEEYKTLGLSETELDSLKSDSDWPVFIRLSNGNLFGCDFIVSATGVVPNTNLIKDNPKFQFSLDGGVSVDLKMQTSVPHIYAAGDVCTAEWDHAQHWLQMRLWTQARQMGCYAGRAMVSDLQGDLDQLTQDFCFELFAHSTKFFNYKVILLGKFNAQGMENDYELLLRSTKDIEYVKVVLRDGRMWGAILIGETDLEETFENLILNQLDLTALKNDLLNPDIDIDDYFD